MKIKTIIIFFLILVLNSCNGQDKDNANKKIENKKTVETFDFKEYEKRQSAVHRIERNDTVIDMTFLKNNMGTYFEVPKKPTFTTIYKEFYANGNIKKKEIYIGEKTKIDISEYYDEKGNVEKVDENRKFGRIKPKDVLKFLEQKKIINLSTGKGRFDEDERPTFEIQFDEKNKEYFITIINGKPNTPENFPEFGEPLAFLPITYKMDGETGKVEELK